VKCTVGEGRAEGRQFSSLPNVAQTREGEFRGGHPRIISSEEGPESEVGKMNVGTRALKPPGRTEETNIVNSLGAFLRVSGILDPSTNRAHLPINQSITCRFWPLACPGRHRRGHAPKSKDYEKGYCKGRCDGQTTPDFARGDWGTSTSQGDSRDKRNVPQLEFHLNPRRFRFRCYTKKARASE